LGSADAPEENVDGSGSKPTKTPKLTAFESAVVVAVQDGNHAKDDVLRAAREKLGYKRLGSTIKARLDVAISGLVQKKLLYIEDLELYLSQSVSEASVQVNYVRPVYKTPYNPYRARGRSKGQRRYYG